MSRGGGGTNLFTPIYDVMYDEQLIEKRMFSICLGKNGGYSQIGGYDGQGHLEDLQWSRLQRGNQFRVSLQGISMNDHLMSGS